MRSAGEFNLFEQAGDDLIAWLEASGQMTRIDASQPLIVEGNLSSSVYVLVDGELSVQTTDPSGNQKQLAILGHGAIVGEMSWLENRPAVATVLALSPCKLLALKPSVLESLAEDDPKLSADLHWIIARKLASQINRQNAWIHRNSEAGVEIEPLRKVFVLFSKLNDRDINLLATLGSLRRIKPGDRLLMQGEEVSSIYLILSGEAEIFVSLNGGNKQVGSSRRGELLGELTLLLADSQGATASVISSNGMELLEINKQQLKLAFQQRPDFAARFYRSLSCMLSQRSRDQLLSRQLATRSGAAEQGNDDDQLDLNQLGIINRAGQRFSNLCEHFQGSSGRP